MTKIECNSCRKQIDSSALFCPMCGAKIEVSAQSSELDVDQLPESAESISEADDSVLEEESKPADDNKTQETNTLLSKTNSFINDVSKEVKEIKEPKQLIKKKKLLAIIIAAVVVVLLIVICLAVSCSDSGSSYSNSTASSKSSNVLSESDFEDIAMYGVVQELTNRFGKKSDFDISNTRYKIGSIKKGNNASNATVSGTVYLYDKYGNFFYSQGKNKGYEYNFDVEIMAGAPKSVSLTLKS